MVSKIFQIPNLEVKLLKIVIKVRVEVTIFFTVKNIN